MDNLMKNGLSRDGQHSTRMRHHTKASADQEETERTCSCYKSQWMRTNFFHAQGHGKMDEFLLSSL